jgi:hypothetical protein
MSLKNKLSSQQDRFGPFEYRTCSVLRCSHISQSYLNFAIASDNSLVSLDRSTSMCCNETIYLYFLMVVVGADLIIVFGSLHCDIYIIRVKSLHSFGQF